MNFVTILLVAACLFQAVHSKPKHGKGKEPAVPSYHITTPKPKEVHEHFEQQVATCYQGYTLLSDGTCVKQIVENATLAEGNITVPYLSRCPPSYSSVNGECMKFIELPLSYFCPSDYEEDGSFCAKSTPGEVVTSCSSGELRGDVCVLTEKKPHIVTPKCPEESQPEYDGLCWKIVETFDCTPKTGKEDSVSGRVVEAPKSPVPIGKKIVVSKGKEQTRLRALHPKKEKNEEPLPYGPPTKNSVSGKLVTEDSKPPASPSPHKKEPTECPKQKELVSVSPPHASKVSPISQTCARKVPVDAIAIISCPDDFQDLGEDCVKETTSPPTNLCLSNGSTEGNCPPTIKRVPKVIRCSDGKSPVDGACIHTETTPEDKFCAEGYEEYKDSCIKFIKSSDYECPPGLKLNGDKCIGTSVRPSVSVTLKPPGDCENKY